jgi:hypothetical protein
MTFKQPITSIPLKRSVLFPHFVSVKLLFLLTLDNMVGCAMDGSPYVRDGNLAVSIEVVV